MSAACMIAHTDDMVLFLETCTAEVSSGRIRGKDFSSRDAARKDSAVHVSLSSDSLVKQPESRRPSTYG